MSSSDRHPSVISEQRFFSTVGFEEREDRYRFRRHSGNQWPSKDQSWLMEEQLWREFDGRESLKHGKVQINLEKRQGATVNKQDAQRCWTDVMVLLASLKECAKQKDLCKGSTLHDDVRKQGLLQKSIHIGSGLINMYGKCGAMLKAQEVFDELPFQNAVSWTALIAGYAHNGHGQEALKYFACMQRNGFSPDAVTYTCILKACSIMGAVEKGEEIHAEVVARQLLQNNTILGNALVDMYAKCGMIKRAQRVFNELPIWDTISWNALIVGYILHGQDKEALSCFNCMQCHGFSPDAFTFASVLKVCGTIGAVKEGEVIHAEVIKQKLVGKDVILGNALLDMYAKFGAMEKACEVFDQLPGRTLISWSALMTGYAQHGHADEALDCFECMQHEGCFPDAVAFVCILKICGSMGASEKGEELHAKAVKQQLLGKCEILGSALVDMYGKCGTLEKAQKVFNELLVHDVISWSALIAGYAQLGQLEIGLNLFNQMIEEGVNPNIVTLSVLLSACGHIGLADEGVMLFVKISTNYDIMPTVDQYACMIDIFSRAGLFNKVLELIEKLLPVICHAMWVILLGACQKWFDVALGSLVFENLAKLDGMESAGYVCMSNIYVIAAMPEEATRLKL